MSKRCSFCGNIISNYKYCYEGIDAYICKDCIDVCNEIKIEENYLDKNILKPHELKMELDKYVIGQEDAKKKLSVEVYNHYKRISNKNRIKFDKNNILLVGPSGSGKTYLLEVLSRYLDLPFVSADATLFTEAGYSGKDIESILLSLLNQCNGNIEKAQQGIVYIDEIDKIVSNKNCINGKDVGGEGVQNALLKMIEGSDIDIDIDKNDFCKKQITFSTKNVLFICGGAFEGIDKISKHRIQGPKIGFCIEHKDNIEKFSINAQDVIEFGFKREFVGRFSNIISLNKLNKKELYDILTKSKDSILKQYKLLFKMDGIKLKFDKKAIEYIIDKAFLQNVGARGLKNIISEKMYDLQYRVHLMNELNEIVITKEYLQSN